LEAKRSLEKIVDFISPRKGEWMLDVCCGTGTLSIMIAEKVGLKGAVVGVDLSHNMIKTAKQKGKNSNVEFVLATAELLPFKENTFNKVLCSLGLHEMTKTGRRNTLKEIQKTLKRNGILNVCDGNLPKNPFVRFVYKIALKVVEEETAYNLIFKGNLWREIRESGFKITEHKTYFLDVLQMISACA
jgi:ubiquinone/menaquinone biosynthesis C-methylase UbiE